MKFMDWVLDVASEHPELENAMVSFTDDWLDILLPDGRTFRFRPAAMIKTEAPEESRREILNRLISIGVSQAQVAEVSDPGPRAPSPNYPNRSADVTPPTSKRSGTEGENSPVDDDHRTVLPIVRTADYFVTPSMQARPRVHVPLTDFIGVGLSTQQDGKLHLLHYDQLPETGPELGEVFGASVVSLRQLDGREGVELVQTQVAGVSVLAFLQPAGYESSWFADVDLMQQILEKVSEDHPDDVPLFVPASVNRLYIVFVDDPHLKNFFELLWEQRDYAEAIYPLPHTLATDGWREWIPFPGSEISEVLGALRHHFRARIYSAQAKSMLAWGDYSAIKSFEEARLSSGERVSVSRWDAKDRYGSIPDTDFVTFHRERPDQPWDTTPAVNLTVRTQIVREKWPEGISRQNNIWPPRWRIDGFPSDELLEQLRNAEDPGF